MCVLWFLLQFILTYLRNFKIVEDTLISLMIQLLHGVTPEIIILSVNFGESRSFKNHFFLGSGKELWFLETPF